jgi:hypothetical protein
MDNLVVSPLHEGGVYVTEWNEPIGGHAAENVTACCSAMPTSNALFGILNIIMFSEQPVGMAGVTPTI